MKRAVFRADASADIGYGHFVRSLALADILKDSFDCVFHTMHPSEYQLSLAASVCHLEALPPDDSRFDLFLGRLLPDDIVVLDNYFFTEDYIREIQSRSCKVVLIDDFFDRESCADFVIHPCESAEHAILRKPFLLPRKERHRKGHWVVAFGGSDPLNLTEKYVRYLKGMSSEIEVSALVGESYLYSDRLSGLCEVHVKLDAEAVAGLFDEAENVLCSASSVCYEALSRGCHVYGGWYVGNQKDFYDRLCRDGLITPLGDLKSCKPSFIPVPDKVVPECDFERAPAYYCMLFKALSLEKRNYTALDENSSRTVWEVRNLPEIRKWMTNPEAFSFASHCSFVESLADRKDRLYYAFFEDGEFVGSYDFVNIRLGESAERGLFVNPEFQGRHIATMMELLMDGEIRRYGVRCLLAEVLKVNEASLKYHLSVGYSISSEDDRFYFMKREI